MITCAHCGENFTDLTFYLHNCRIKQAKMPCRCAECDITFASVADYQKHKCEKAKMTREEALAKLPLERWYGEDGKRGYLLDSLEKLGLLKFDEPKEGVVAVIVEVENYNISNNWNFYATELVKKYERVRLELWPEGLVLWVGGEIVWRSWHKNFI